MSDDNRKVDSDMFSYMTQLKPDDPAHRCKSCGKQVGPGEPVIMWVSSASKNLWHFKCAWCRGFMEEVTNTTTSEGAG